MRGSCSRQRYSHILTHIKIRIAESKTRTPRGKNSDTEAKTGHRGKNSIQGTFSLLWFAIPGNRKSLENFLYQGHFLSMTKERKKEKKFCFSPTY